MTPNRVYIAFVTILRKEVVRFMRIWTQTLLPSAIIAVLYFLIFGTFVGSRIGLVEGVTYIQFIVPGLVMMAAITNSFTNVVTSFFGSKFMRNIDEVLVSPTPNWVIIAGFCMGGVLRGILVAILVLIVGLFFTHLTVASYLIVLLFILLTTLLFSLAGLLNGIFARNFDDASIIPTFVLTPLIYLGGVFYSVRALAPIWKTISLFNPVLYMINGFRYGFFKISDVSIGSSITLVVLGIVILLAADWYLLSRGAGLRS